MFCLFFWLVSRHLGNIVGNKIHSFSSMVSDIYSGNSSTHLNESIVKLEAVVDTAISFNGYRCNFQS